MVKYLYFLKFFITSFRNGTWGELPPTGLFKNSSARDWLVRFLNFDW